MSIPIAVPYGTRHYLLLVGHIVFVKLMKTREKRNSSPYVFFGEENGPVTVYLALKL